MVSDQPPPGLSLRPEEKRVSGHKLSGGNQSECSITSPSNPAEIALHKHRKAKITMSIDRTGSPNASEVRFSPE